MFLLDAVADALAPFGLNLVSACSAAEWDARAPRALSSDGLLADARAAIVVGSAGRELWRAFRAAVADDPTLASAPHPLDAFVSRSLAVVDPILAAAGVRARKLEAAFSFEPRVDFRALGELSALGAPGPFGLLIHPQHGPWWGLRGAFLVDVELPRPPALRAPCIGCSAPCVGAAGTTTIDRSTAAMRLRCPIGAASRYDDEQLAYHHNEIRPPWLR